uniref:Uncharacterized protein n=1 Tax=Avena sativa TaxID=4498 RepID=A0ACD6AG02_AVESA
MDKPASAPGGCLEVRLFYVRLSPRISGDTAPPSLALALYPAGGEASPSSLPLRLDRRDPASGEATYVSTVAARFPPPAVAFEVADQHGAVLLRGSLRRCSASKADSPAWVIDCVPSVGSAASASAFEVYVAGCCAGEPAVLTHALRLATPEEAASGLVCRRSATLTGMGDDDDMNIGTRPYPEGWYSEDEDGQLTWFNAGVRVGVGIGLGVCVGVGIGVGLLMSSYQATARNLKRRFF